MTPDPTIDQRIAAWLTSEAPSQMPDRVLVSTFAITRATRQVGWLSGWRSIRMRSMPVAIAAGAVAILILILGGVAIIGSGKPAVSPTPTSTATSHPPASAAASLPPSGRPSAVSALTPLGAAIVGLDNAVRSDLALPATAWAPALSPDGTQVAYVDGSRLIVRDVTAGSNPRDLGLALRGAVPAFGDYPVDAAPAWSPDATTIAFVSGGDVYTVPADGSASPRKLTTDPHLDEWPAWSPDGRTIYYINAGATPLDDSAISPTQELWRVAAAGGKPVRITHDDVGDLAPDVSRGGTMAIWADGGISGIDLTTGRGRAMTTAQGRPLIFPDGWNPRWSPDGSKLALLVLDGSQRSALDPALGVPDGLPMLRVEVIDRSSNATVIGDRVAGFWNPVTWTPDGQGLLINRADTGG